MSSLQGSRRVALHVEGAPVGKESKNIRGGYLGRGYNVLNGRVKIPLFEKLEANYVKGIPREKEKISHFSSYEEYEHEIARKSGISRYEEGMFTLFNATVDKPPLMTTVEKSPEYHHLLFELERESYGLNIPEPTQLSDWIKEDPDVSFIMTQPFNKETRHRFYSLFEKYGTHWVRGVTFGSKAELRWSFQEKEGQDAFASISHTHSLKRLFVQTTKSWKEGKFQINENPKLPKQCFQQQVLTSNFHLDKSAKPKQIAFRLEEISQLFPIEVAMELEIAIRTYLVEMQPLRDVSRIKEGSFVSIFSIDTGKFLQVDASGRLILPPEEKMYSPRGFHSAQKFEVKRKGNRVGLKSLMYGKKFLSKAMTRSYFHFHRLQFMGPHESFVVSGDYLFVCGNLHSPTVLHLEDGQVHHVGKKRSRLCLLAVDPRESPNDVLSPIEEEPIYQEDVEMDIHVRSEEVPRKGGSEKGPMAALRKDFHKSNSTSSLYIQDTITLPNINELTRRMAHHLHAQIVAGHKVIEPKMIDIFSEVRHPLTHHAVVDRPPSVETTFHFLNTIFKVEKLSPEPGIMCLVYMKRVMEKTRMTLHASNWRRLVVSTLILASKVWEDLAVWNVDFVELFPRITVKDLNKLERYILECMEFNVTIKASEYVKTFFSLGVYGNIERSADGKPMNEEALKKLEVRTAASEKEYFKFHKSASHANLVRLYPRGILS